MSVNGKSIIATSFMMILMYGCKREKTFRESQLLDAQGVAKMHDERGAKLASMGVMSSDEYKFVLGLIDKGNKGAVCDGIEMKKLFAIIEKNKKKAGEITMLSEVSAVFIYGKVNQFPDENKGSIREFGDYMKNIKSENVNVNRLMVSRGEKIVKKFQ